MFEHKAKEFMTHRSEIVALDGSIPLLEAVDKILSSGHRSYPVYEENLDTIHGIVSITDAMREYVYHKERRNLPLAEIPGLLTEVFMVPETSTLSGILKDGGPESHLIIVVDEYGQTSGLISMADLFDEFAGEFVAEYDTLKAAESVVLVVLDRRRDFAEGLGEIAGGGLFVGLGAGGRDETPICCHFWR